MKNEKNGTQKKERRKHAGNPKVCSDGVEPTQTTIQYMDL